MNEPTQPPGQCPRCGAALGTDAPEGLCPRCLSALPLGPETVIDEDDVKAAGVPLSPEELAPHFPQLEILECLGRGGMGVVYKARQKSLNRFVALKLLAPERVADPQFAERFAHEAKALAALNHPSIVTIHDFGQAGGFFYLLMEFVDGVNLRQAMKAGRFTPEQALAIVPPVCEALQYAHEHGIVHRDIKPENLLLDREGRVKIADFGIAKIMGAESSGVGLAESQPAGTPQYMAPEQKEHRVTDHRADIYSLGVVLYEMLTGELPADKLQPPSKRVQVDVRIDEIVLRALEVKPELRFATAAEFRTEVETLTRGASGPPVPPAVAESGPPRFSRAAFVGACWVPLFLLAFVGLSISRDVPVAEHSGPTWWQIALMVTLVPLGAAAPFGTTLLGWIAVAQIRRLAGRLHGMWLAVFDGLLFPMAGLVWLFAFFWWWLVHGVLEPAILADHQPLSLMERIFVDHTGAFMVLATFVTALVAGFFIVRAVWRAVNGSATGGGEGVPGNSAGSSGVTSPPTARTMSPRPAASSIALAVLLLLLGILIPVVGIRMHNNAILAASDDHVKNIRSLQSGVTSVSAQMGEANAVAGRAASRAGNSAERDETRAQAREEQHMYEQRSVNLRADLERLQAALAVAGNRQVDAHPWRAVSLVATGLLLALAGGGMLIHIRRKSGAGTSVPPTTPMARWPFKYARLLPLIPLLIFGIIFVKFVAEVRSPSGVTSFHVEPVEVRDNVVIVDVTTVVARGNAELRSMLNGSRLPAATEASLQDTSFAPFAGTLIKPTPNDGNPAWRILSPGRQMWRLGFALPDAALAKEAFANLRPIGPLPAKSDLTFAGTLFEVSQPGGETYRASLEVGLPIGSGDPRWLEVMGHSQQDAHTVTLSWEVFASQPGLAQFSRAGSPIMVLKRQPQTELYSVTAGLELTRLDADRVLFVRRIGYHTMREEFSGNFRDLADELLRTKTMSAKTACGTTIELCQFQGKPFTVQVQSHASPLMNGSRTGVFGIGMMGIGAALLLIVAVTGIVLLVLLVRKGSTAGKIVLCVVGTLLLLLAIACAVFVAVRSLSQDSEQTATELPQSDQSSANPGAAQLEKSLPAASLPDARILVYAATGIERGWVQVQSRLDAEHELAFFLGEEGSGWFHAMRSGEKGDYQSFIEKSDAVALENGGKGRGFLIRSGPGGDADRAKSTVYVTMEPGGPVPAGELIFRTGEIRVTDNATRITFADIVTPDGQRVPMSARVRPATQAASAAPSPGGANGRR